MVNPLENDCENANTLTHGGVHLVVLAHLQRRCVGVLSKHQRVNLYYCALDSDGVLKDTRFILVRVECPYVQFVAASCVISTKNFIVGVTNGRERKMFQSMMGRSLLNYV